MSDFHPCGTDDCDEQHCAGCGDHIWGNRPKCDGCRTLTDLGYMETKTMDEHYPSHDHPASILPEFAEVLAPCGCTEDECVPSTHEGQRYCASCDGDLPAVTRSHPGADKDPT